MRELTAKQQKNIQRENFLMGKLLCNNVFINCNKVIKGDAAGRERNLLEKLKAFD